MDDAQNAETLLRDALMFRDLGVNDLAPLRRLHVSSFRKAAGSFFTDAELDAYESLVLSEDYTADRYRATRQHELIGAHHEDILIATGEWARASGPQVIAQIRGVFVSPFFTGCGIGSRIVGELEARIGVAGFKEVGLRSTVNATPFFESLGYRITSHGQQILTPTEGLPVTFMRKNLS